MQRASQFFVFVLLFAASGCGQGTPTPVAEKSPDSVTPHTATIKQTVVEPVAPVEKTELVATAVNGTAESTFQQTLVAFQEGRLDKAFDFLPASYQSDVQDVVHEFAEKMDGELWSKCFQLLGKVANILKTKKTLILSLDNVKSAPQIESIKPVWDSMTDGFHDLANGDVSNLSHLKTCEVRNLLSATNRMLAIVPLPKFGEVTVKTVNATAETATLSYRENKGAEPRQVEFVKIEGKWLPKSIATGWSAGIADAKSKLASLPDWLSSAKPQVLQKLDEVSVMLDQLQHAKTAGDFNRAMLPLIMAMKFGTLFAEQTMQNTEPPRKGKAVHLVIDRELSDDEMTQLKNAIVGSLEDKRVDYEMIPSDGKTRCRFTPIPDTDAMVSVLQKHFNTESVRIDPATKSVLVELK